MRTVERLEELTLVAESMGYRFRHEPLAGAGGVCEYGGSKWLFFDLGLSVIERLEMLKEALLRDPSLPTSQLSDDMKLFLGLERKAAA